LLKISKIPSNIIKTLFLQYFLLLAIRKELFLMLKLRIEKPACKVTCFFSHEREEFAC